VKRRFCCSSSAWPLSGVLGIAGWEYNDRATVLRDRCATRCTPRSRFKPPDSRRTRASTASECTHGAHVDAAPDDAEAHARQGTVGMIAGTSGRTSARRCAPRARGVRGLPLARERTSRQDRRQEALRHRPGFERDRLPDHAAHLVRCRARGSSGRRPASTGTSPTTSNSSPPTRSAARYPWSPGEESPTARKVTVLRRRVQAQQGRARQVDQPRRMECFDCHQRDRGTRSATRLDVVDDAIAGGRIDRSLPEHQGPGGWA